MLHGSYLACRWGGGLSWSLGGRLTLTEEKTETKQHEDKKVFLLSPFPPLFLLLLPPSPFQPPWLLSPLTGLTQTLKNLQRVFLSFSSLVRQTLSKLHSKKRNRRPPLNPTPASPCEFSSSLPPFLPSSLSFFLSVSTSFISLLSHSLVISSNPSPSSLSFLSSVLQETKKTQKWEPKAPLEKHRKYKSDFFAHIKRLNSWFPDWNYFMESMIISLSTTDLHIMHPTLWLKQWTAVFMSLCTSITHKHTNPLLLFLHRGVYQKPYVFSAHIWEQLAPLFPHFSPPLSSYRDPQAPSPPPSILHKLRTATGDARLASIWVGVFGVQLQTKTTHFQLAMRFHWPPSEQICFFFT